MAKTVFLFFTFIATVTALGPLNLHGAEIDWSRLASKSITLFYPGRTSWEFLTSDDHRLGARFIARKKRNCAHCHLSPSGELDLIADEIAAGTAKMKRSRIPFEDDPIPGKPGILYANMQAAYDNDYLYVRIEWESRGRSWRRNADPPDMVSIQMNKLSPSFKKYGCFITCHKDLDTMPDSPPPEELSKVPYYKGLDRRSVRLYAYYTRSGVWKDIKPEPELKKLLHKEGLIDLWNIELKSGTVTARDGWIFEDRRWDDSTDVQGSGGWKDGRYSVVLKRKLSTGDREDVQLKQGDIVYVGIAIHDDGAAKRKHYVSFPIAIGIDTKAGIRAVRVR